METSSTESSAMEPQGGQDIGRGIASDIKQQAGDIKEQARVKAHEAARSGQTAAADELHHLAEGVRRSVESWDEAQHAWIRQGLSTAADSLERFSSNLRDRDIADLASDMEVVVRRHPVIFAGACAMAGFALMRFLKSSRRDAYQAGAGHGSDTGYQARSMARPVSGADTLRSGSDGYSSSGTQDNL